MLFIIVGLLLIVSELLVPLFGFFGLAGLTLVIMGSSLSYNPELAEYGMAMIFASSLLAALLIGGGLIMAWKAYRSRTQTGKEGMIGDEARVIDWSGQQGRVFIDGETWHAEAAKEYDFAKDDIAVIRELRDLTLIIEPKP